MSSTVTADLEGTSYASFGDQGIRIHRVFLLERDPAINTYPCFVTEFNDAVPLPFEVTQRFGDIPEKQRGIVKHISRDQWHLFVDYETTSRSSQVWQMTYSGSLTSEHVRTEPQFSPPTGFNPIPATPVRIVGPPKYIRTDSVPGGGGGGYVAGDVGLSMDNSAERILIGMNRLKGTSRITVERTFDSRSSHRINILEGLIGSTNKGGVSILSGKIQANDGELLLASFDVTDRLQPMSFMTLAGGSVVRDAFVHHISITFLKSREGWQHTLEHTWSEDHTTAGAQVLVYATGDPTEPVKEVFIRQERVNMTGVLEGLG